MSGEQELHIEAFWTLDEPVKQGEPGKLVDANCETISQSREANFAAQKRKVMLQKKTFYTSEASGQSATELQIVLYSPTTVTKKALCGRHDITGFS